MWHMHVIDVKDSTPFSIVLVCACFLPKTTGGVALHTLDCIVFADGYIHVLLHYSRVIGQVMHRRGTHP